MTATLRAKRTEGGLEEILEGFGLTLRDTEYDLPIPLGRELIHSGRWQSVDTDTQPAGDAGDDDETTES